MANPFEFQLYVYNENVLESVGPAAFVISDDEEEEEDEDDDEDDDEDYVAVLPSSRVSENCDEEERNKRRRTEVGEASSSPIAIESSQGSEWSRSEIDGLLCPICMEPWVNNGEHHISCLPCGHIYGMSCIKKWLQQRKKHGKCPQCNRKCSLKDVRKLYASRLVAVDEESQKRIQSLEAKCAALESKGDDWHKKEAGWQKRKAALHLQVQKLAEKNIYLEQLLVDMQSRQSEIGNNGSSFYGKGSFCNFELQKAFDLSGARVFDMDTSKQIILVAQKPKVIGGFHTLTKLSLIAPFEMEDILLPSTTNGIRDLHISPSNGSLALYASVGKKLSVISLESNSPVINYDLKCPAWSCSWDLNSSHYLYAGLQNGCVSVFDMRQTVGPVKSLFGLTSNPVHTLQSLGQTSSLSAGGRTILSAAAIGVSQWNFDSEEGPSLVPNTDSQGVCISLAYCPSSDDVVVSYRPKVDMSMEVPLSQQLLSPLGTGQGVQGSHVLFKRDDSHHFQMMGSSCANVSKIRLPKCAVVELEDQRRLFACGDEVTGELVLHELPSFRVLQQFKLPAHARDIKYSPSHGILGCLSEKTLQLFHAK
ncbi:hypothetical protein TanjilG_09969 [Lupinus angustifolius]|uniref:RING-type E3 ubiquitin transferase n=1 Tax=Lupinus angustifolius TaxID=3871 RepID=A0A1J7FW92_LUPAN|nr:PREDICTED: E3 ubiquitin-protein ligase RFWD3 isoform X1 [Lupinus angustifolius]XP_019424667.1 PREDICTED: E3 ubiquitin-protein ligase RFWD3 isoform X1 [Lupinus angustifolius]OIV92371.1 hypothetical protein TanjilG_09969 [Lupinus angustifolius]